MRTRFLPAGAAVTIDWKDFGVLLTFHPTVLGDGRIRLEMTPVVSEPSQVNAVADVLPATVSPADPSVVAVSFPSDILKAELVTKGAYFASQGIAIDLGQVAATFVQTGSL